MFEDFFTRFKWLIIVLLPALALTGIVLFLTRNEAVKDLNTKQAESNAKELPNNPPSALVSSGNVSPDLESRVKDLEDAVLALNKKINTLSSTSPITPNVGLSLTPSAAPVNTTTTTTSSSNIGAKSVYLPVGFSGSSVATQDFESIGSQQITIDTNNYPGYKQFVLEANIRVSQGNGTGFARLFNSTDGTSILNSDINTTSGSFSTKTSAGFTLPAGSKTYTVQLKSLTGYSVDLQLVRLRVDF